MNNQFQEENVELIKEVVQLKDLLAKLEDYHNEEKREWHQNGLSGNSAEITK